MTWEVRIYKYLILFLPIALVTGPFIPDAIISVCSLIFFCRFLFLKKKNYIKYFTSKFFLYFILFYGLLLLSSLLSENIIYSTQTSLAYIRFGVFVLVVQYVIDNNEFFLKQFFFVFLFIYFILCFDSFFQYVNSYNIIGLRHPSPQRITSFFGNDIKLGSYMMRLLPIFLFLFFSNKYRLSAITEKIFFSVFALTILVVFLSGERAAFISAFIIIFLTFLYLGKKFYKKIIVTSVILIISIITIIKTNDFYDNRMIKKPLFELQNTLKSKIDINLNIINQKYTDMYLTSLKMFKKNPILGIGPKNFRKQCDKKEYTTIQGCSTHPHHTYLQLLAETGVLGFLFILTIFAIITIKIVKKIKINYITHYRNPDIFLYIAFFVTLNPFLPSGNFFNNWISIIYFLPVGILLNIEKNLLKKI